MSDTPTATQDVDQNVATNLRVFRERSGLSQEELAQRMSERGCGFTQATIWKIESGQRTVKISEAAALADALKLLSWTYLTAEPDVSRHHAELQASAREAHQAYASLKQAAAVYLQAQIDVSLAVRQAREAGIKLPEHLWTDWIDTPAERAVIEARVEWAKEDEVREQTDREVDVILQALRDHGHEPPHPDNWVGF